MATVFKQSHNRPAGQSVLRNAMALPHKWVRNDGRLCLLVRLSKRSSFVPFYISGRNG